MADNKKFSPEFLRKIMQLETSGGKFMEHEPANPTSMHAGTTAMGRYGLMPLTVSDLVKEHPEEYKDLKEYVDFSEVGNPNVSILKQEALKNYLKQNPMVEDMLAKNLQQKIEQNVYGNEPLGAVAWHAGSEASPNLLRQFLHSKSRRGAESRDYLSKFNKLKGIPEGVPTLQEESKSSVNPSLLSVMLSRPTAEDLMSKQADEEVNQGLWSQLKNYLSNYYQGNNEE